MNLLKVGTGKYVNTDRVTYIEARKPDKVIIQFQNEVSAGGIGVPPSFLEIKGADAQQLIQWIESHADHVP